MSRKGENIYKRKDGRWEARYIKSRSPDGAARYGYCYGRTYRSTKEKLSRAIAALPERGSGAPIEKRLMSDYCDEWLRLKRSRVKESTYVKYTGVSEKYIKPRLGGYRGTELTSALTEQFAYDLLHSDGLSAKTVRDILGQLRSILRYIEVRVPSFRAADIVYPKEQRHEMRVLSREEQRRLTDYLASEAKDDLCCFGTLLALLTGLRIGEICALKWGNISLGDGILHVGGTMQRLRDLGGDGKKTHIVVSDPKSFASERDIPLEGFAAELCRRFYADKPLAYVLTGSESRYVEPRALQYKMRRYCETCELSGVHFHSLRHSFATRCVEVGFDIKSLSEVLGHSSPQITLERYVHSSIELKRENMDKLAAIGY